MLLTIYDNATIADLQDKFNECFPGLKIEFFSNPHHWKQASVEEEVIDPKVRIGDVRNKHDHGILEIKSWYQTGRVEQDFKRLFGLNVQIFRRENGKWRETVASDKLTLEEQQQLILGLFKKEIN
jgi:hypothetical protein